jgi:hypothetical protein
MALTELQVKNAKPKNRRYMIPDGHCLYLEILPSGVKSWRMRYFSNGSETTLTLGKYPDCSLKTARELRNDVRKRASLGEEPFADKRENADRGMSFGDLFEEYLAKRVAPIRSPERVKSVRFRMRNHALSRLGDKPANEIDEVMLLEVLRAIEAQDLLFAAICSGQNHKSTFGFAGLWSLEHWKQIKRDGFYKTRFVSQILLLIALFLTLLR